MAEGTPAPADRNTPDTRRLRAPGKHLHDTARFQVITSTINETRDDKYIRLTTRRTEPTPANAGCIGTPAARS